MNLFCSHFARGHEVRYNRGGQDALSSKSISTLLLSECGLRMNEKTTSNDAAVSQPEPFRFSMRQLLVVVAVCGVLLAIVVPTIRAARESARRMQCSNNLKSLALAMQNYHDVWKTFPPAFIPNANGKPMHSWRMLILPYVEQTLLYDVYDMNEPWDGPKNGPLANGKPVTITNKDGTTIIITPDMSHVFRCPSAPASQGKWCTNYVMVVGPGTISSGSQAVKYGDMADGTVNTIMIVEIANSDILWTEPRDLQLDEMSFQINDSTKPSISSPHVGGAFVADAFGSVTFLDDATTQARLKAMLTIAGGEKVDEGPNDR